MRKTRIVTLSLPEKRYQQFIRSAKKNNMTRSEFFREIFDRYSEKRTNQKQEIHFSEKDLAEILKSYWDLRASNKEKIIIICLAVIERYNKILIGARKKRDKWVKNLTWVFPGGSMRNLNFAMQLEKEVKKETNLNIEVHSLVSARIHPDSGFKDVQIVALYFHCKAQRGQEEPGGDLIDLKWVKPSEVFTYFTTSTSDEVTKFLYTLENGS